MGILHTHSLHNAPCARHYSPTAGAFLSHSIHPDHRHQCHTFSLYYLDSSIFEPPAGGNCNSLTRMTQKNTPYPGKTGPLLHACSCQKTSTGRNPCLCPLTQRPRDCLCEGLAGRSPETRAQRAARRGGGGRPTGDTELLRLQQFLLPALSSSPSGRF